MPAARSLRPATRLAVATVAVAALALGITGCGGNEDVDKADFQEKLIERTTVPEGVAACITDRVYEQFDQDEINEIVFAATVEELQGAEDELQAIDEECKAADQG